MKEQNTYTGRDFLDYELHDDNTSCGGIAYIGETLKEFLDVEEISYNTGLAEINEKLKEAGILPIDVPNVQKVGEDELSNKYRQKLISFITGIVQDMGGYAVPALPIDVTVEVDDKPTKKVLKALVCKYESHCENSVYTNLIFIDKNFHAWDVNDYLSVDDLRFVYDYLSHNTIVLVQNKDVKLPVAGTRSHGITIKTTINKLTAIVGEPELTSRSIYDKVQYEWVLLLKFAHNNTPFVATIYDYEEYRMLSKDEEINFHIGGVNKCETEAVRSLLELELLKFV